MMRPLDRRLLKQAIDISELGPVIDRLPEGLDANKYYQWVPPLKIGQKIEVADLPEDLLVEEVTKASSQKKKQALEHAEEEAYQDAAFHKRKESNAKTANYGIGQKAIMNKKKKHG